MEVIAGIFGLSFFVIMIALSFIPFIIALCRKHNDTLLIFLVVFFLGWTIIGWIIAFIWSLSSNVQGSGNNGQQNQSLTNKLNELSVLLNKKLITQEEHDEQRRKILESK